MEKVKEKLGKKAFDMLEDMLEKVNLFDQLAEMIKTVIPLKFEVTVKGKKSLEVNVHGVKKGQLWISIKRIREEKPEPTEEPKTEEEKEEVENAE